MDEKIENNEKLINQLDLLATFEFRDFINKHNDLIETQLGDFVQVIGGYSYAGDELQPSKTAMLTIKNFGRNGGYKLDGLKEIIPSPKIKQTMFASLHDIFVAHTDITQAAEIIGRPILFPSFEKYESIVFSMDIAKVHSTAIGNYVLYQILKQPEFTAHAKGFASGTTVLHMSKSAIPQYKALLPNNLGDFERLNSKLKTIYIKISLTIDENKKLQELKQLHLKKFFV